MSRAERSLSHPKEKMSSKEWALFFATLAGFLALSFGSATRAVRRRVHDRAGGKCEGCQAPIDKKNSVVGHLDHGFIDQPEKYSQLNNLRLHCPSCEAEWHLSYIGKAKDIGLSEVDNSSSALGRLIRLAKYSEADFLKLFEKYPKVITDLFEKYDRDFADFISPDEREREPVVQSPEEKEPSLLELAVKAGESVLAEVPSVAVLPLSVNQEEAFLDG